MRIDENNSNHLTADEGKVLRRISDGWISGSEIYLGYAYRIGDKEPEEPLLELPEHYEEIDDPSLEEVILDEETELIDATPEPIEVEAAVLSDETVSGQPRKVTLSDYRALEAKVAKMMEALGVKD